VMNLRVMSISAAVLFSGVCNAGVGRFAGGRASEPSVATPAAGEILYQIMPITWRDFDNDPNRFGDFRGLTASLDYLHELGVTAIYLNPIFPSPAYHGYQHGDASLVNERLGTRAEFLAFVDAAHAREFKVYLDFVAYGISHDSPWYKSAHAKPESEFASWLAFTNAEHTKYQGYRYRTWNGESVGFIHWNLADAGPANLVTSWAKGWLDPDADPRTRDGVDGFRLDHVYAEAPEGWGATIAFWQTWSSALRAVNPDVFIFGEPGEWGNLGTDLLTPTGFDAVIAKPFEFAARDAIKSGSAAGLYKTMGASIAATPAGKTLVVELNDHDSDRLASAIGDDAAKGKLAAAILLSQPFPPCIYAGDEIGMLGKKANHGGDANDLPMREPFKWNAVAGQPMTDFIRLNAKASAAMNSRDRDGRSVEEQRGVKGSLLEEYKRLIAVRKANPALSRGRYVPVKASNPSVWSFLRADHESKQTVLVVINLGAEQASVTLDLSGQSVAKEASAPADLLSDAAIEPITEKNKGAYKLVLSAHGVRYIRANLSL